MKLFRLNKLISIVLIILFAFTTLVACVENAAPSVSDNKSASVQTDEGAESKKNEKITFKALDVVDNDECSIKITGIESIEPDDIWGYTLNVKLENKSKDKNYMFAVESAAVNGLQCDVIFAAKVAAGKKSNDEIYIIDSSLEKNGITDFTNIELTFLVYDSDEWDEDYVVNKTVHVYPYGKKKAVVFKRKAQPSDNIVIDNDDITFIVIGYEHDEILGFVANIFLINKTDKELMFSADDVSVNGYMADPFFASSVLPGKCRFTTMSWEDDLLDENDIDKVEEIEFLLRVYDANDWSEEDILNESITLNP